MAPSFAQAAALLFCAGSVLAAADSSVLVKRVEAPQILPGTWLYQGCYTDAPQRTLTGPSYADGVNMTADNCIAYCDNRGYAYAGTEYSQECYCGNSIPTTRPATPSTDCNMGCTGNTTESCGGPNRLSVYWNGQTDTPGPSHNAGVLGFGYMGCYTEGTVNNGRALTYQAAFTGGLTIAKCIQACTDADFTMAGAEYSNECYCGNEFSNEPTLAPEGLSGCSQTCLGNKTEFCGAGYRLDVYKFGYVGVTSSSTTTTSTITSSQSSTTTAAVSTTTSAGVSTTTTSTSASPTVSQVLGRKATIGAYTRLGCYTDTVQARVLPDGPHADFDARTLENCSVYCAGTSYFGVEYGGECFCGNTLSTASTKALDSDCSFICPGNQYEYCGAGDRLELYKLSSLVTTTTTTTTSAVVSTTTTTSIVPTTTTTTTTTLATTTTTSADESTTTTTTLATTTSSGDSTTTTATSSSDSSSATSTSSSDSSTSTTTASSDSSSGTTTTTSDSSSVTTTTTTTTSVSTTTTSSTTTSATPTQSGLPSGWKYVGCYTEGSTGRALSNQQPGGPTNTVESCIARCISLGFSVAGMEYSEQCFCDNFVYNGAAPAPEARCNMPCSGDSTEMCGAGDILSLYNTGTLKVFQPPVPQEDDLPGDWEYAGCWTDSAVTKRALVWQIVSQNNTATNCLSQCSKYGFMSAGMQYGEECYCGDEDAMLAQGSTQRPESECNIACSGDKTYICGGGNRNSYYKWTGDPLYEWAEPTGPDAGQYDFLIGGVVIPLITTLGINDKIVFMEKGGTGAPNTTGTYELDLNLLDDMSKAWRPLHVKTDIFCAAGVTLPDKAGRQLNVGGWSGRSTYGVRLYTPDGSPGVLGKNDWQEDETKISLLDGRWYPSAINLANGSVLVVGGETGSNAAATPTVEILPLPAGGYSKYMDWLQRTDPNNLYPFMWVLPSGGIFIMYYNEARILDERTLDTTKILPIMPGSVNNEGSGRTYPLEGTGVILPLHPPYTAPATFMACGGSSTGAGQAIDNCISVQPTIDEPVYTIERMPTPRVMSCICALPDGTFLIVNGALQGVAGFGLATGPNLQAVLYDPSKPLGSRMSIMASTIVARLYHSEAILLPDGRVLISGSNPEDGKNPEEYRVEVFSPPYALNGQAPPTFSLPKKDWGYGETITITANIPSGDLGGVRVSMMAAVSSTHGNSMGQRTLFLAVSCGGATCDVVAPPSSHVAPPGWYQIFVLDGPRPGKGLWIRVGGDIADAAGIGNWPAGIPGIDVPGLGSVDN